MENIPRRSLVYKTSANILEIMEYKIVRVTACTQFLKHRYYNAFRAVYSFHLIFHAAYINGPRCDNIETR